MAWQRRAKKEIAQGWKWMRKQDSDAAAEAERWAEEHKEDMKEADRVLYRSDESYYGKTVSLDPEDAESMDDETGYPDPEAFLPEGVRDRIYDDHAYVKNPYLPKDSESGDALYLSKGIVAGLHDLTDLQREVIFRNVINGEDVSSIAESKKCSTRNIRDIRNRALKALRAATTGEAGSGSPDAALFVLWGTTACRSGVFYLGSRGGSRMGAHGCLCGPAHYHGSGCLANHTAYTKLGKAKAAKRFQEEPQIEKGWELGVNTKLPALSLFMRCKVYRIISICPHSLIASETDQSHFGTACPARCGIFQTGSLQTIWRSRVLPGRCPAKSHAR